MDRSPGNGVELRLAVPDELVSVVAERVAELLGSRIAAASASPYLTTEEAAAYLRASKQRVFDLTSQGRLKVCKDGSRNLYARADLDAYLHGRHA